AGHGRVGVAVDEHQVRRDLGEQRRERLGHPLALLVVGPVAERELAIGPGDAQLAEEDGGQLVVVVLSGVDEHLLVLLAQQARDRRGLDELRPVPDDRDDPHYAAAASSSAMRSATAAATSRETGPGASKLATPSI